MCICVSLQQNRVFWRKKSANSHFALKKMVRSWTPSFVNGIGLKKSQPQWTMKNYDRQIGAKKQTARKKNGAICSESSA
jgi:hypothetical protein